MNLRRKGLVALALIVLVLAVLFVPRVFDDHVAPASPRADPSATSDIASAAIAMPSVGAPIPGADPKSSASQQSPLTGSTHKVLNPPETTGGNIIEVPAFDSAVDPATGLHNQRVAAECWGLRGSAPWDFVVTLDREMRTSGDASALISASRESAGYATMFQRASAAPVRGKRVEFSVDLRTRGATRGANLVLRAEDARGITVAFDNMWMSYGADHRPDQLLNRGVTGDTEWSTQHVVVDIPDSARVITYGVSLDGGGKVWIDNARIEAVPKDMATTALPVPQWPVPPDNMWVDPDSLTRSPRNLEFDLEAQAGAAPCN